MGQTGGTTFMEQGSRLTRLCTLVIALLMAACDGEDDNNTKPSTTDRGNITISWQQPDDDVEELALTIRQTKLLEDIAKALNATIKLPKDLPVVHKRCGEANAYYDPAEGKILLCYEMMLKVAQVA